MPPIWVGFWAPNSLDKLPFFGRFSINKGGLSRNWQKMGGFPPKFIIKVGMTANFGRPFRQLKSETGESGSFW